MIDKGTGQTWIDVQPGVELQLDATITSGTVELDPHRAGYGELLRLRHLAARRRTGRGAQSDRERSG